MSSKHTDFYQNYIDKLQKKANEAVKEAQQKTFAEFFDDVAPKKIRDIYNDVITRFYEDYHPTFYDRRGSLYKLLTLKSGADYLEIGFDPSKISYRNGYNGEDGLYTKVFKEGWHGGANIEGKMLIPWTAPPVEYDGDSKPWAYPEPWGRRLGIKHGWEHAQRSTPPLLSFKQALKHYEETEYQQDYEKIWNKYKSNIKIEM